MELAQSLAGFVTATGALLGAAVWEAGAIPASHPALTYEVSYAAVLIEGCQPGTDVNCSVRHVTLASNVTAPPAPEGLVTLTSQPGACRALHRNWRSPTLRRESRDLL